MASRSLTARVYTSADRSPTEHVCVGFHFAGLVVTPCLSNASQIFRRRRCHEIFQEDQTFLLLHLFDSLDDGGGSQFHPERCGHDLIPNVWGVFTCSLSYLKRGKLAVEHILYGAEAGI